MHLNFMPITLLSLLSAFSPAYGSDDVYRSIPFSACLDGTVVMMTSESADQTLLLDSCNNHGGASISLSIDEELTLDCRSDECEIFDGYVLGLPQIPDEITLQNSGMTHNIIVSMIIAANPRTKDDFIAIAHDLMKLRSSLDPKMIRLMMKWIMDFLTLDIQGQVYAWETIAAWKSHKYLEDRESEAEENEVCLQDPIVYEYIRNVMALLQNTRDLNEVIHIAEILEDMMPDTDELTKAILDSFLHGIQSTYAFWDNNVQHLEDVVDVKESRRLASEWPWEMNGVTMCTASLALCRSGRLENAEDAIVGGVIAGAIASAGAYFRW